MNMVPFIHPGDTLPNGATVLDRHWKSTEHIGSQLPYGIVLAKTDHEYVTWEFSVEDDGTISTYWGHYHSEDLHAAVLDFVERTGAWDRI